MLSVYDIRELKQRQQEENELTVLDVEEGNKDSEQSSHSDLTHQLPVAMVGTECQCAFAQVSQTLWKHKQQRVNSSSCTHTHRHLLSQKFTCVWYRVPFVLPPT